MLLEERDPTGWVLKALREAGNSLVGELYGLDERTLRRRPREGEWCLKEIAAHLRDAEELALLQMNAVLDAGDRPLPVRDIDALPLERDYLAADFSLLLSEFRGLRRQTVHLLWGLMEPDWQRRARHPYRGDITLREIAHELAQHDLEHLWQVRRLKHELGEKAGRPPRDRR